MSDETLDKLFKDAAEKIEVEFEHSSWDKLKCWLEEMENSEKKTNQGC